METELWKEKNKRTEKNNVTVSKNVNHVRMLTFSLKLSPALPLIRHCSHDLKFMFRNYLVQASGSFIASLCSYVMFLYS